MKFVLSLIIACMFSGVAYAKPQKPEKDVVRPARRPHGQSHQNKRNQNNNRWYKLRIDIRTPHARVRYYGPYYYGPRHYYRPRHMRPYYGHPYYYYYGPYWRY